MNFIELLQVRVLVTEIKALSTEQRAELDCQLYPTQYMIPLPDIEEPRPYSWETAWTRAMDGTLEPVRPAPPDFRGLAGVIDQYRKFQQLGDESYGLLQRNVMPMPYEKIRNRMLYGQDFAPPTTEPATWCDWCKKWDCIIPVIGDEDYMKNHQGMLHPHPWPVPDPDTMREWCNGCGQWGCKIFAAAELVKIRGGLHSPPFPVTS